MSGWYSFNTAVATMDRPPGQARHHDELDDRAELIAHRRARRRARSRRVATGAAGIAALLLLWQAAAMILNDQVALPSVAQTVQQFVHYLDQPYPAQGKPIWFDLYISLRRILIGFVIGVAGRDRARRRDVGQPGGAASRRSGHRDPPAAAAARLHPAVHRLAGHRGDAQGSADHRRGGAADGRDDGGGPRRGPRRPAAVRQDARRLLPVHHAARADPGRPAVHPHRHALRHGRRLEQHRRRRAARRHQRPRDS